MLLFKKKFLAAIQSGVKCQTIRLWPFRRMKAGQRSYVPGVGYISITDVAPIDLAQLTDADAVPDGFATADLLRAEVQNLYAKEMAAGFQAYRIRFSVFPPDVQASMKAEKQRLKAAQKAQSQQEQDKSRQQEVDKNLEKLRQLAENRPSGGGLNE